MRCQQEKGRLKINFKRPWLVDQGIELKFYLDRFRFIFDKGFNILECLHLIAFTNFDGIGSMFEDRRFETRAFDTDRVNHITEITFGDLNHRVGLTFDFNGWKIS